MSSLEENGVKARRVQVERIEELGGGMIEWRMATCEDPGGMVPKSCAKRRTQERIAKDVGFFLAWFRDPRRKGKRKGTSNRGINKERENPVVSGNI